MSETEEVDPHMLAKILKDILDNRRLTSLFQPIIDLKAGVVVGYEALMRGPSDSPLHAPTALLSVADRCGRLGELDRLCREVHIGNFAARKLPGKLFLNVCPETLMQADFRSGMTRRVLGELGLTPDQVVIELTEHYPIEDFEPMRRAIAHYRSMGFAVAIDDLGAGYAGLRLWSELRPDFVKFDRHFIQNIDSDPTKVQFIRSMQEIAAELGCQTIAEGIETEAEFRAVSKLGVAFGQGYFFARPSLHPELNQAKFGQAVLGIGKQRSAVGGRTRNVACLIRRVPSVLPGIPVHAVADMFVDMPSVQALAVVGQGDIPVGLVSRYKFMNMLGSRYGRDLYGRMPVSKFMETRPLIIEKDQPLEQLSQLITSSREFTCLDDFIITENGEYVGTGTLLALLREITDLQISHARHANPLTLLPGNVLINEHLDKLLADRTPFAACYCDLDYFKPFNDTYGYRRGDQVICLLGRLLQEEADSRWDFIGHIGGDDFLAVLCTDDWQQRCAEVLRRFDEEIGAFYDPGDLQQGGIWSESRDGSRKFFPLICLSIGAVYSDSGSFSSCHAISAAAVEMKQQAKKISGSNLFVDRRQQGFPVLKAL
jgi:EAL domain-containing protein (putative c-di-GMP-specific phosphodiesterase class I)/GGDEF domain-containing protein